MTETTFLLGLGLSTTLMFVGTGLWLRRPLPQADGPITLPLGQSLTGRADLREVRALRAHLGLPPEPR